MTQDDDEGRSAIGLDVSGLTGVTWGLQDDFNDYRRQKIERTTTPSSQRGPGSRYPSMREGKVRATWATMRLNELFLMHAKYAEQYDGKVIHSLTDPKVWARSPQHPAERIAITHAQLGVEYPLEVVQMLASEVLTHLRAVLDSVIYHLAWLDSGKEQNGTAWRVASTPHDWTQQQGSLAKHGITPKHIAKLEQFHPVAEPSGWAQRLNSLVNRDKHRLWPAIGAMHVADVDQVVESADGQAQVEVTTGPMTTDFVFADTNGSVTDNLLNMSYGVSYVLLAFQPDFGEFDLMTVRQADGTSITWEQ